MKVLIIGGMAAGCKAAARLKRIKPEYEVKIIEKRDFVSFGACGTPLFASGDVDDFFDLAKTPWGAIRDADFFENVKDVRVKTGTLAEKIDKEKKIVYCKNLKNGEIFGESYDKLLLATGAAALQPKFNCAQHERVSSFHAPSDAKLARKLCQTGAIESAVIVGGGYIGCELAEALASLWGIETTIVEIEDRLLPRSFDKETSRFLEKTLENEGISLRLSSTVEEVSADGDKLKVSLKGGETLETDSVFTCLGVAPQTGLAKQIGAETGRFGGIVVDEQMRTNVPDVWAAGDCVEVNHFVTGKSCYLPLGSLSNRQGRVVAQSIAGRAGKFEGAAGTVSMQVFGLICAAAGLNSAQAKAEGLDFSAVAINIYDRPDYHPDHKTLNAQMVFENSTGRLFGLQLVGAGEVTRYIDAFSIFLQNGATAYDLLEFEHAYNPPHSSPINPLNILGATAINLMEDKIRCFSPIDFDKRAKIIDVREEDEAEVSPVDFTAERIPLDKLRGEIGKFDKFENYLFLCQRGTRSYEAARIFSAAGFSNVAYIAGGASFINVELDEIEDEL